MTLLLALLALQEPPLIERLGDDDPDVREEAAAALARQGARAMPDLERALVHSSPEVRARAADLLMRLPEYSWRLLSKEQPLLAPLWNALIDSMIHKKPVPAGLWEALGCEIETLEVLEDRTGRIDVKGHPPEWIARRLLEEGTWAVRRQADLHGVEGEKAIASRSEQLLRASLAIPDLPERLAGFGADDVSLEEIHGAILQGRETCLAEVFNVMSREDWDLFLRFLVNLRRRPGAAPAHAPDSREAALRRVAAGPWVAGIARAVRRAVERREEVEHRKIVMEKSEKHAPELRGPWRHLEELHRQLGRLDSELARQRYVLLRVDRALFRHDPDLVSLIQREKP